MAISLMLLVILLPAAVCVGLQTLAMRFLAPTFGMKRPELMTAAALAARQFLMASLLLIILPQMPIPVRVFLAVAGALAFGAFQCRNLASLSFSRALAYISGALVCSFVGMLMLGGALTLGGSIVHQVLVAVASGQGA